MYAKVAFILTFLSFLVCTIPAGAVLSNVYIAQASKGFNTGADCANAFDATFFNTTANWGSRASQIGPGTTVHVCGTWTGTAGAQFLKFKASGTAGNVIALLFEPGAVMQAPYFAFGSFGKPGGAIDLNSQSHLLIDGGATCGIVNGKAMLLSSCNGIIRNTDNGTNLRYQESSSGIYSYSGNPIDIEIRNLVISTYIRVDSHNNAHAADGVSSFGIYFDRAGPTDLRIHHNNVQHAARTVLLNFEGQNASNIRFYNNYIADMSWGLSITGFGANTYATNVKIFNNEITNWANWVSPSAAFHSNGIMIFDECNTGELCSVGSADSYIYNNYIHGDLNGEFIGASASGFIQASCGSLFAIFNNHIAGSATAIPAGVGNGIYFLGCDFKPGEDVGGGNRIYNNTFNMLGAASNCAAEHTATANFHRNNIFYNGCNAIVLLRSSDFNLIDSDHNIGYLLRFNQWACDQFATCKTLAQFPASPYFKDSHSYYSDPLLDSNDQLSVGSPAIRTGINLTNLGIAELNVDAKGIARPATGPWDIGAFQFSPTDNINIRRVPIPPTNMKIK